VAVAGYLPILCLAPFAGVVADRLPRRRVLLVTQALFGLLALALGVLVWTARSPCRCSSSSRAASGW